MLQRLIILLIDHASFTTISQAARQAEELPAASASKSSLQTLILVL